MVGTWHAHKGLERRVPMLDYIDVYNGVKGHELKHLGLSS